MDHAIIFRTLVIITYSNSMEWQKYSLPTKGIYIQVKGKHKKVDPKKKKIKREKEKWGSAY